MRADRLMFLIALVTPSFARADDAATATLPLSEVLRLHDQGRDHKEVVKKPPPMRATIHRMEMTGRLLNDALEVRAHVELTVLAADEWVAVPILHKDSSVQMTALPVVNQGLLTTDGGQLTFLTREAGTYAFDFSFIKSAVVSRDARRATIQVQPATLSVLKVQWDEGLFQLTGQPGVREADGVRIHPDDHRFSVAWVQTSRATVVSLKPAPPAEPVITRAHATTVSTLEGNRITRIRYALRFGGTRPIVLGVPEGNTVEKLYVNGVAVPFVVADGAVRLEVAPPRAGDETGTIELALATGKKPYFLSGDLTFEAPTVSWPVNELYVDVFLPEVFNYRWSGGSLAPEKSSPPVEYAHQVPCPGKKLSFHQYLITSSSPTVDVHYSVDLTGQYYRP